MALKNIRKQNITDVVYEQFMNAIVSGEWQPGRKIPSENELTATLGVSRVSVRSALQKLQTLGLVESRQGEGTFVCRLDGAQYVRQLLPVLLLGRPALRNLLELRAILDCEMAALAAERATPDLITRLRDNLALHRSLSEDRRAAAECDLEFHLLVARATGNPLLEQVYLILKEVFLSSLYDLVALMGPQHAYHYHQGVLNAIAAHRPDQARKVMREHVRDTMEAVTALPDPSEKKEEC